MGDQEDFRAWFRENEERLEADFRNRGASLFWRQSLVVVSEFGDGNAWHTLRRERVYQSPPVLVHQEDLTLRNTILNLPPGTEIIPSWGIRARSLLLNRCPVCLKAERLGHYVCVQGVHPTITESGGLSVVPRMSLLRLSGKRISPRTNQSTSIT